MSTTYPAEFKPEIIQRYEKGEFLAALSQDLHIVQSTLYQWRKQYCAIQTPTHTYPPRSSILSTVVTKTGTRNGVIPKSGYLSSIPLQRRLATLESIYNQPDNPYSVYELCDALEVARGTFYNHIFRRADRTKYQDEYTQLMLKVQQVFDDSQQRYGAEKIRIVLAENGTHVSAKRIAAIMQELNLKSIRVDAKKQYKKQQKLRKKNLLQREFTADHPNQTWVSDITYFRVNQYWVYLCVIIDLYSRKVVSYRVSRNASTHLVTTTFKAAYQMRGKPKNLTFHSDRGTQYTSATSTQLLQKYGVKRSFSATGRPIDNAVAEAFFATFKKEEAYRREYTSEDSFRKSAERYIQFYNEIRPHQTLKYKTPQDFEAAYQHPLTRNKRSNEDNP